MYFDRKLYRTTEDPFATIDDAQIPNIESQSQLPTSPQKDSESAAPNENSNHLLFQLNMPAENYTNPTKLTKGTISATRGGTSSLNPYLNTFSTGLPSRTQTNFKELHESGSSKRHRLHCEKPAPTNENLPKKSTFVNFYNSKSKDGKNPLQPHRLRGIQKSLDKEFGECLDYNYRIN